ncbi:MAG TPA: 2'-5' RNA ligase family protein [Beutenbergiaceae bacterium]|nr:2'-5' RNA ligase family protein [Beutenbergiaceae bacterium]
MSTSRSSMPVRSALSPETPTDQIRIGVSIPIPEPYASSLARVRTEVGDQAALSIPPHITLVPPAVVNTDDIGTVIGHLTDVAAQTPPFVLELRGTATFRPITQVVFVVVTRGHEQCTMLHQLVNDGPLRQQMRFPYHPHVTIAHDVPPDALDDAEQRMADFEATFPVAHFSLYEFGDDGVWRDVRTFVLTS